MRQVTIRREGVSADEISAAIHAGLSDRVEVTPEGSAELKVQEGFLSRARVTIAHEPGATAVKVTGSAPPGLILMLVMRYLNERNFVRRVAAAIESGVR